MLPSQGISVTIPQARRHVLLQRCQCRISGSRRRLRRRSQRGKPRRARPLWRNELFFTGDMGFEAEDDMLAAGVDVSATVLKVAHHGSAGSSSTEFFAGGPSAVRRHQRRRGQRLRSSDRSRPEPLVRAYGITGQISSARSRQVPTENRHHHLGYRNPPPDAASPTPRRRSLLCRKLVLQGRPSCHLRQAAGRKQPRLF